MSFGISMQKTRPDRLLHDFSSSIFYGISAWRTEAHFLFVRLAIVAVFPACVAATVAGAIFLLVYVVNQFWPQSRSSVEWQFFVWMLLFGIFAYSRDFVVLYWRDTADKNPSLVRNKVVAPIRWMLCCPSILYRAISDNSLCCLSFYQLRFWWIWMKKRK